MSAIRHLCQRSAVNKSVWNNFGSEFQKSTAVLSLEISATFIRSFRVASCTPTVLYGRWLKGRWGSSGENGFDHMSIKAEAEDVEDLLTLNKAQKLKKIEDTIRFNERAKVILKHKIIERKYFRPLSSANILSWKAKEQIRYLYSHNPNEDGIEEILDLFPITEHDLKLLLKNKKLMKNADEIRRHDEGVNRTWQRMLHSTEPISPRLQQTLDNLIDSGQIKKLRNAGGAVDVPEIKTPTLHELAHRKPVTSGRLTNLLIKHGKTPLHSTPPPLQSSASPKQLESVRGGKHPQPSAAAVDGEGVSHHSLFGDIIEKFQSKKESCGENIRIRKVLKNDGGMSSANRDLIPDGKEFVASDGEVLFRVP